MSCEVDLERAIRDGGRRFTPQRLRVATALRHAGGHRTAEEIHALVASAGSDADARTPLPLSTVYRALDTLKALRLVSEVDAGGRAAFEWVDNERPHHHLVCQQCGAEQRLDAALLDRLSASIRGATGFEAHLDHLAVAGLCAPCLAKRVSA
jgi:Fur family ferric uptake transcriptional regulator